MLLNGELKDIIKGLEKEYSKSEIMECMKKINEDIMLEMIETEILKPTRVIEINSSEYFFSSARGFISKWYIKNLCKDNNIDISNVHKVSMYSENEKYFVKIELCK